MRRREVFDNWVDGFNKWQREIGLPSDLCRDNLFETKYGEVHSDEIEFGEYAGERKWDRVTDIPDQRIRDAVKHLISVQGDTELASTEQQRSLIATAPSDHDLSCLLRVMREEMRHGWQMADLLVNNFGNSGKIEARRLLERRADLGTRLLDAFNEPLQTWLDFFTYTAFIDRDGKYQLTMLSHSGFAPLARSMEPMLKEEAFHLFTGFNGLSRVVQARKVPMELIQKSLNKWIPRALDLFGKDRSSSAQWFYVWGLKGRVDEDSAAAVADQEHLNEDARQKYSREVREVVEHLNELVPPGRAMLYVPDYRFNRRIGEFAEQPYSIHGNLLPPAQYQKHLAEVLSEPCDIENLSQITKEKYWIMVPEEILRGSPKG